MNTTLNLERDMEFSYGSGHQNGCSLNHGEVVEGGSYEIGGSIGIPYVDECDS